MACLKQLEHTWLFICKLRRQQRRLKQTWKKWQCVKQIISLKYNPPGGGGSTPGNFWRGCARLVLQILTRFQTKKCNFPHPFSDQTSKIHIRFQTWPLGRNYVIITKIRAQTKQFFKSIFNSHIFLSFLLIWNSNDKDVCTLL